MQPPKDDLGYWMGWLVAALIASAFLFYIGWPWPGIQSVLCNPEETKCAREWWSALGGWAGTVFAGASVLVLARQIKDANRHQQVGLVLSRQANDALSRQAISQAKEMANVILHGAKSLGEAEKGNNYDILSSYSFTFEYLRRSLAHTSLIEFERNIVVPNGIGHVFLKTEIESLADDAKEILADENNDDETIARFKERADFVVRNVTEYCLTLIKEGERYIETTSTLSTGIERYVG